MRCEDVSDRLLDLASSDARSTDPEVLAHLDTCSACRAAAARVTGVWSLLGELADVTADSDVMRARFAALVRDESPRRRLQSSSVWQPALAAAALIAAFGLGLLVSFESPNRAERDTSDITALRQELGQVRQMLTLSLMQQRAASERIRGVTSAARIDDPHADLLAMVLETLMHDPDVNVRLASIRALERFREQPAVREGVTRALTREQSPLVSIALIDFVVEAMDEAAVNALRRLAGDATRDAAVRKTAAEGAERLRGKGRI